MRIICFLGMALALSGCETRKPEAVKLHDHSEFAIQADAAGRSIFLLNKLTGRTWKLGADRWVALGGPVIGKDKQQAHLEKLIDKTLSNQRRDDAGPFTIYVSPSSRAILLHAFNGDTWEIKGKGWEPLPGTEASDEEKKTMDTLLEKYSGK